MKFAALKRLSCTSAVVTLVAVVALLVSVFIETQKMLKLSGNLELYVRDKRDAAILFAIQHRKSIDEANDLLDQLGVLPLISDRHRYGRGATPEPHPPV